MKREFIFGKKPKSNIEYMDPTAGKFEASKDIGTVQYSIDDDGDVWLQFGDDALDKSHIMCQYFGDNDLGELIDFLIAIRKAAKDKK